MIRNLNLKKKERKTREDFKERENKLRVDVRKLVKREMQQKATERQQKILSKELSILHQPPTCGCSNHSRDWSSGTSKSSEAQTRSSETSRLLDRRKGSICSTKGSCCFQRARKRCPENSTMSEALITSHSSSFSERKVPNAEVMVANVIA